jgi:ABC-type transport system involved in multi-copper enzyme maturation permease subunit
VKNEDLKKSPPNMGKDIDIASISYLVRTYLLCFSTFGIILSYYYQNSSKGLLVASVVSIPFTLLIYSITNKTSEKISKLFYAGRKPTWNMQEQLQGDLQQVMFLKRQKQFPQALQKVNEILKQEPEFGEAFFLKAQILWEGYETAHGARRYLNIAKNYAPPKEYLYRWICSYQDRINDELKNKNNLKEAESLGAH